MILTYINVIFLTQCQYFSSCSRKVCLFGPSVVTEELEKRFELDPLWSVLRIIERVVFKLQYGDRLSFSSYLYIFKLVVCCPIQTLSLEAVFPKRQTISWLYQRQPAKHTNDEAGRVHCLRGVSSSCASKNFVGGETWTRGPTVAARSRWCDNAVHLLQRVWVEDIFAYQTKICCA